MVSYVVSSEHRIKTSMVSCVVSTVLKNHGVLCSDSHYNEYESQWLMCWAPRLNDYFNLACFGGVLKGTINFKDLIINVIAYKC